MLETENDKAIDEQIQIWYEESSVWDRMITQDVNILKEKISAGVLMTLGKAAQSPVAAKMLHMSQLLVHLNTTISGRSVLSLEVK